MSFDYVSLEMSQSQLAHFNRWGHRSQPHMFTFLSGREMAHCMAVNHSWQRILDQDPMQLWKQIFLRDFSPPLDQHPNYRQLYAKKMITAINIRNGLSTKTLLCGKTTTQYHLPAFCYSNNRFHIAFETYIESYSNIGELEYRREIPQSSIRFYDRLSLQPVEGNLLINSTEWFQLTEANTGRKLFSRLPKLNTETAHIVDDKVVYTTNPWGLDDAQHRRTEVWDYRNEQLLASFPSSDWRGSYKHHLIGSTLISHLISEDEDRILGHSLETKKRVFEFSRPAKIAKDKLLVYSENIDIYGISDGELIGSLQCGRLKYWSLDKNEDRLVANPIDDGSLDLWEIKTEKKIATFYPPSDGQARLAAPPLIHNNRLIAYYFHPDEKSHYLQIWNLKNLSLLHSGKCLHGQKIEIFDDHLIALRSWGFDGHLQFWDILEGKFLGTKNNKYYQEYQLDSQHLPGKILVEHSTRNGDTIDKRWIMEDYSSQLIPKPPSPKLLQLIGACAEKILNAIKCGQ